MLRFIPWMQLAAAFELRSAWQRGHYPHRWFPRSSKTGSVRISRTGATVPRSNGCLESTPCRRNTGETDGRVLPAARKRRALRMQAAGNVSARLQDPTRLHTNDNYNQYPFSIIIENQTQILNKLNILHDLLSKIK